MPCQLVQGGRIPLEVDNKGWHSAACHAWQISVEHHLDQRRAIDPLLHVALVDELAQFAC